MSTTGRVEVEFEFTPEQPVADGAESGSEGVAFGLALELAMHAVNTALPGYGVEQLLYGPPLTLNVRRRCYALVDPSTRRVSVRSLVLGTAEATPVTHLEGNVVHRKEPAWLERLCSAVRRRPGAGRPLANHELEAELCASDGWCRSVPNAIEHVVLYEDRVEATLRFSGGAWPPYCLHPAIVDCGWLLASFWELRHGRSAGQVSVYAEAFHVLEPGARAERLWLIQLPPESGAGRPALALAAEHDGNITAVLYGLTLGGIAPALRGGAMSDGGIAPALRGGAMWESEAERASQMRSSRLGETAQAELAYELERRSQAERRRYCAAYIERVLAAALEPTAAVQPLPRNVPFQELGVTSAQAVAIAATLSVALGYALSSTVLFDHPTIDALVSAIVEGRLSEAPRRDRGRAAPRSTSSPRDAMSGGIAPALRGGAMSVAVVGMDCRLPGGVAGPDDFWRLLSDGVDAVGPVSPDRVALLGRFAKSLRFLAALDDIDRFDARFFGISDREASAMDPQQRLLLEVTWHALEHAGVVPSSLMNTRTGVFVGVAANEYARLLSERDAYSVVGNAASVAAGRLSYVLGTRGPSLCIDTACSSSLVAVCMACDSLTNGDADLAIAGGANLVLDGSSSEGLAAAGALSASGRCAAFDDAADGYVRGEGCAVVVLRRLADAQARGDRILAVVRGHSIGHGGRSNGLAAPNKEAQADLIRRSLERSGVRARDVGYVEAHGTGTTIGDAVELQSLAETYGASSGRSDPVWIGTAKTNIGHLEAAAGIAGFIKAVLVLDRGRIPPNLHHTRPLRSFDWKNSGLRVVTALQRWPDPRKRLAAVNAFGISGTYAHVVLEAAPQDATEGRPVVPVAAGPVLVALSGRSEHSVRRQAADYARHLALSGNPSQLALTAGRHRDHFEKRAAVVASGAQELSRKLSAVASGERQVQERMSASPTIAFLYPGQGSQYLGMARELFQIDRVFREAFEHCDGLIVAESGVSAAALILGTADPALLERSIVAHPALFCVQYALGRAWEHWGVTPDFVLGHSFGEYAAACLAGVFRLPDAVKLIVLRARLIDALPADGGMLALAAGPAEVEALLRSGPFAVEVGAINATRQVVVSGDAAELALVARHAQALGIGAQALPGRRAFHSRMVDPILDELEQAVAAVDRLPARGRLVSSSLGRIVDDEVCAPGYWRAQTRDAVRFAAGVETLVGLGTRVFVEIGPHPVLLPAAAASVKGNYRWLPSLRKGRADATQMLQSAAELYVAGRNLEWGNLPGASGCTATTIPGYAFERRRYWVSDEPIADRPDRYYRVEWMRAPAIDPDRARRFGSRWIISGDEPALVDVMTAAFTRAGVRTSAAEPDRALTLSAETGADSILYMMAGEEGGLADPRQPDDVHAAAMSALQRVLHIVRRFTADSGTQPRVWLAMRHRGGVDCGAAAAIEGALWSLARVVSVEHPELWGGMASVHAEELDSEHATVLVNAVLDGAEDQLRIERGDARVPRLVRAAAPAAASQLDREGSYLVTGGLGHIGLHVAQWLVARGAKHLVLTGRQHLRAADSRDHGRRARVLDELRGRGVSVRTAAVDVCDRDAMRELFRTAAPRIVGVFHAAGTRAEVALRDTDMRHMDFVLRPKVLGAWTLHELVREFPVDHFVLFSSLASVVGGRGQGGYAAANGFLDGLAAYRRQLGLPGLSIAWGPWGGEGGMAAAAPDAPYLSSIGITELKPDDALEALRALLHAEAACWAVADVDWEPFRGVYEARRRQPMFAELRGDAGAGSTEVGSSAAPFIEELASLPEAERTERLHARLRRELRQVLGADHTDDELERDFQQLGLDSLGAVQLRSRIERLLGAPLSTTMVFDNPSLGRLVARLLEEARAPWNHPEAAQ